MTGFSESDFEKLDAWLLRRHTGITDIVELEAFLTAIVIGPTTLNPMTWLPKVWGGKAPKFASPEEVNQFMALVMSYYNDLVMAFECHPGQFEPTFYESKDTGRRVVFGSAAGWKELKTGGEVAMHKRWSPDVAPAVRAIHQFWMPFRMAEHAAVVSGAKH